jgi:hypothetical protein
MSNVMPHDKQTPREALAVLGRYAEGFRELVNARVWSTDESPPKALRLNADGDWEFICVAMDVVGDACLALGNFLEFSLDGPTKYESAGERYLRLYGVLNAVYLQQESVAKLYALMNCPSPRTVDDELSKLAVRTLRHQVGSHSVDYRDPVTSKITAHVPVRIGLSGFSCMVTEGRGNSTMTVRLDEAIHEHCKALVSILDRIYAKSIHTLFHNNAKRIQEFQAKLQDLRDIAAGDLLIRGSTPDGQEIRVRLVGARDA